MDIRTLQLFITLANTLHYGRASELAHISPSGLSRAIKQLEETLGSTLFERDNRRVALTPEGVRFLEYAREALSQWQQIRDTLQQSAQHLQGELSVYCSVTASYSFLYELLSRFRSRHPQVEIKLHTGDPEHALGRISAGLEDISIAARPDQLPGELAFKPIAETPLLFIAPRQDSPLAELDATTLSAGTWQQIPMILSESGIARTRVDRWFAQQHIKPHIYAQVAGNEAIVSMVSLGFGVGVVPAIVLHNSPLADTVHILPIQPALKPYQVGLFTQQRKLKNRLIQAFWEADQD